MSVLNKVPFINTLLNQLSQEEVSALSLLMNGQGNRTELKRIMDLPSGDRTLITAADKGVHMCSLQVKFTLYNGYLVYPENGSLCVLIYFTDFQRLNCMNIDVSKGSYELVDEYLDINEMRYIVKDLVIGESGVTPAIVENMIKADKDILSQLDISYDSDNDKTTIIFPKNIMPLVINTDNFTYYFDYLNDEVYGDEISEGGLMGNILKHNGQITIVIGIEENETTIKSIEYILFSKMVYTLNTYYLYNPVTSGGTKLYRHELKLASTYQGTFTGNQIIVISKSSTPLTDIPSLATDNSIVSIYSAVYYVRIASEGRNVAFLGRVVNNAFTETKCYISSSADTVTEL